MSGPDRPPAAKRRRPPPGRISPEALAARRGGAVEGLAWLGRPPEAKASLTYRFLRLVGRFAIFGLFRFKIRTSGREHLPSGRLLPRRRRASRLDGSVRGHARDPDPAARLVPRQRTVDLHLAWRERLIHRVGGLLPVWRGGVGIDQHVASAKAVIANGAVFAQMPEGTVSGPAGPDRAVPCRLGGHRPADGPDDRAAGDRRHRGALPRAAAGVADPSGHHGPCPRRSARGRRAPGRKARARSSPWPAA